MKHTWASASQCNSSFYISLLFYLKATINRNNKVRVRNLSWVKHWETYTRDQVDHDHIVELQADKWNERKKEVHWKQDGACDDCSKSWSASDQENN